MVSSFETGFPQGFLDREASDSVATNKWAAGEEQETIFIGAIAELLEACFLEAFDGSQVVLFDSGSELGHSAGQSGSLEADQESGAVSGAS